MNPAARLWARIVLGTALSLGLLLTLAPDRPAVRLSWPAALAIGWAAGLLLFLAVARRRPQLPRPTRSAPVLLAKLAFVGLWAANEEVVWRRVALGELLGSGAVPAVAGSTIGFALVHRTRRGLHLGTGGIFGALYVSTGVLAASVAAHWAYNVLVGALVERERERAHAPP
jgi:membrane protease YdiL (CAAX protease family)